MGKAAIPDEVKKKVLNIVERFNKEVINYPACYYIARFRGRYLYLDRSDYGIVGPICRLEWTGEMDDWDFAIYRYSDERYDPEEWLSLERSTWTGL